jgi:RimJ/RimL family protein N-acetyltransferase
MPDLRTDRLLLRRWRESDLEPWAAMNADPEVREHLGELLTREQSDAAVALMQAEFDERGLGWWALEARETGEFIGRAGLDKVDEDMPFAGVDRVTPRGGTRHPHDRLMRVPFRVRACPSERTITVA